MSAYVLGGVKRLYHQLPPQTRQRLAQVLDALGPLPQRITAGPAKGMVLWSPFSRRSYCDGRHEAHVMAALAAWVKPGMVVCDVGSHLGAYALALAQLVGPAGRVYAFEPLPRHLVTLRRTLAQNRLEAVTVVPMAVGDKTGTIELEESANEAMTHVVLPGRAIGGKHQRVPMTTLDDWMMSAAPPQIDLMKLDIEGYELAALQGASTLIARQRPVLCCELHQGAGVHYAPEEVVAWLKDAGYAVRLIPAPQRPTETLPAALARLQATETPAGWMSVVHIWAEPEPLDS